MPSVRSVHETLTDLVLAQEQIIHSVKKRISETERSEQEAAHAIEAQVKTLVLVGDDGRYAALTRASKRSGKTDFSRQVQEWTAQDEINRKQRAEIEAQAGTRETVAAAEQASRAELEQVIKPALRELSAEISAFDATMQKIEAHNAKYKTLPITKENHASFDKFSLWNFILWCTRISPAAHNAYKTLHAYKKEHGKDYYDVADKIVKQREAKKNAETLNVQETAKHDSLAQTLQKMDSLDSAHKGPEKIAALIRKEIYDLLVGSDHFQDYPFPDCLAHEIEGNETQAILSSLRTIGTLKQKEKSEKSKLKGYTALLNDLQKPLQKVTRAASIVPAARTHIDLDDLERYAKNFNKSMDANSGHSRYTGFDFTRLYADIDRAVDEYEEEQRRIAEEQRRREEEDRRQRAALAALAAATAAANSSARSSNSNNSGSWGISNSDSRETGRSSGLDDVFNQGSNGVSDASARNDDVFSGGAGISDSSGNDDIAGGSDGIKDPEP